MKAELPESLWALRDELVARVQEQGSVFECYPLFPGSATIDDERSWHKVADPGCPQFGRYRGENGSRTSGSSGQLLTQAV